MVTLTEEVVKSIEVGDEKVGFHFRNPTPAELNKFLGNRYTTDRKRGMVDNTGPARCEFFDLLITGIDNFGDKDGVAIGPERKELVPTNWKSALVQEIWENIPVVDAKN